MYKQKLTITAIFILLVMTITACGADKNENTDNSGEQTAQPVSSNDGDPLQLAEKHLQKNDEGAEVKSLQEVLQRIGYDLESSGTYGSMTTWAMTDYQMQKDSLDVTGMYNDTTRHSLQETLKDPESIEPGKELTEPDKDKTDTINNPHEILVLVNKNYQLPDGFEPLNLVEPEVRFPFDESLPKKQMRQVAATALEDMFAAANNEGLELFAQSGFRSFDRQEAIFASNVEKNGEKAANQYSAKPGESEHQTGLTMDVSSPDVDFKLIQAFGNTDEGKWLQKHAADYGFIIRYPEGKEEITQYDYEPWHLRYVGKEAAADIMSKGSTLEEYLGKTN